MPHVIDMLSDPAKPPANEDRCGAASLPDGGTVAWAIDGATPVDPRNRLGAAVEGRPVNDVEWFAAAVSAALSAEAALLAEAAGGASCVRSLLERAVAAVRTGYEAAAGPISQVPAPARPIAALSIVTIRPDGRGAASLVEAGRLGDCLSLARLPGAADALAGRADNPGEAAMNAEIGRRRAAGSLSSEAEAFGAFQTRLREERAAKAGAEGAGVLRLDAACAAEMTVERRHLPSGTPLLLMTDGFYRLVEIFSRYGEASLIDAARARGLTALVRELRGLEDMASSLDRYPRLKSRDDATALLLST